MKRQVLHMAGRAASRTSAVLLVLVAIVVLVCAVMLVARYHQRLRGEGAVEAPTAPEAAWAEELPTTGRFTATVDLTDLAFADGRSVPVELVWDDAWFAQDATTYQPELAYASSVLASLAYAESGYYQQGSDQPAYMEQALSRLGFDEVCTDSYRYRSEIVDEVLSLATQESDVAAYTVATKRLGEEDDVEGRDAGDTGDEATAQPRTLVMVSVRGSYGSEWLSNLEVVLQDEVSDATASASEAENAEDGHPGYTEAAREICTEVADRVEREHRAGRAVDILLVGHSRGGAIANLVAAAADDALVAATDGELETAQDGQEPSAAAQGVSMPLRATDTVRAYTFATPATTLSAAADSARYANIFNVLNPADIMPYLPLESWGYRRFGVDVMLPSVDDADFTSRFAAMDTAYEDLFGIACIYDPQTERGVLAAVDEVSANVASAGDVKTPVGAARTIAALVAHLDPTTVLLGHYPSVYIAWMASEAGMPSAVDSGDVA